MSPIEPGYDDPLYELVSISGWTKRNTDYYTNQSGSEMVINAKDTTFKVETKVNLSTYINVYIDNSLVYSSEYTSGSYGYWTSYEVDLTEDHNTHTVRIVSGGYNGQECLMRVPNFE